MHQTTIINEEAHDRLQTPQKTFSRLLKFTHLCKFLWSCKHIKTDLYYHNKN